MSCIDTLMYTVLGFALGAAWFKAGVEIGRGDNPSAQRWMLFTVIPIGLIAFKAWWTVNIR